MSVQRIGRYEIERELGRGGMAVVYLARDPLMKRQVAIKVLPRQFTFDPQFRARFQREAEIVAALEHPRIVPVYDFGEEDDQPFIVMRCMTGGSLAGRLQQDGALPLAEVSRVLMPLAAALDKAHAKGIIHRDLKPANVMFDSDGESYISDFGIAKIVETSSGFTGGVIVGTPTYMSPEQWKGEKNIDGRSDVYSLGCMLFEMLTGKLPFEADTPAQLMFKHLTEPPLPVVQLKPNLPTECDDIVRKALAKDRDERYSTAGELARELGQLTTQETEAAIGKLEETEQLAQQKLEAKRLVQEKVEQERLARAAAETELVRISPQTSEVLKTLGVLSKRKVITFTVIVMSIIAVGSIALFTIYSIVPRETQAAIVVNTGMPTLTPTQTAIPIIVTPTPVPPQVSKADGMTMMYVPEGLFKMGSDSGSNAEKPVRDVTLSAFWIDKTEVTNAMYALCVMGGKCTPPKTTYSNTRMRYYGNSLYDN